MEFYHIFQDIFHLEYICSIIQPRYQSKRQNIFLSLLKVYTSDESHRLFSPVNFSPVQILLLTTTLCCYCCCCCCLVTKSCLTLCDPMDCCWPGSSVRGIFQTRMLGCVAISFSSGSSLYRIKTTSLCLLNWQVDSLPLCYLGSPQWLTHALIKFYLPNQTLMCCHLSVNGSTVSSFLSYTFGTILHATFFYCYTFSISQMSQNFQSNPPFPVTIAGMLDAFAFTSSDFLNNFQLIPHSLPCKCCPAIPPNTHPQCLCILPCFCKCVSLPVMVFTLFLT